MRHTIGKWGAAVMFANATLLFAAVPPSPGVINFVEGQASIDGRAVTNAAIGEAQLQTGDVLQTMNGRAEMLLSPGVFLRLGQNSEVRMVSSDLLDTRVALDRGSALVEADLLPANSRIRVQNRGSETTLLKTGLYRFSADNPSVAVYDGNAQVMQNDREIELKKGREVNLTVPLKATKFDTKKSESDDALYAWSQLRSEYMSEASAATARTYVVNNWGGWYGTGWYWNPFWATYAWLPGDPVFYSPFGWGYYSPFAFVGPGLYYRAPAYWHRASGRAPAPAAAFHAAPRVSSGFSGGFHGAGMVRMGGGFHGR